MKTEKNIPVLDFSPYIKTIQNADQLCKVIGKVTKVVGLIIEAQLQGVSVGEVCLIEISKKNVVRSEVVGFKKENVLLMPFGPLEGISPGNLVHATGRPLMVTVGECLLGRVLDGLGEPIDGKGPIESDLRYPLDNEPPDPVQRPRITKVLEVGVRVLDGLLTLGRGQRIGIFAGSGVGKSTLMGQLARQSEAEVSVIALIGERGREVRDFIEESLGEEGLKRSVVVVATSDKPPLIRLKGALVGTAIAEYFRDQGRDVLFMMDSTTRYAMAQREVGLATGEPPTTKGYPPSVFALMPKLMERTGTSVNGTITAIYTILVEGGDMDEPVADTARGILDGHIVLSRDLAAKNHFPCVDVNFSVSRLFSNINKETHKKAAGLLREVLARYNEAEDLINIGAYVRGSNPKIDWALDKIDRVNQFLIQGTHEYTPFDKTISHLIEIMGEGHGGSSVGEFMSVTKSVSSIGSAKDDDDLLGDDLDLDNLDFDEF
ncbi:MAG: flagellar protein export ATPase FliI [Candidatus Margulisbacteria bacterium GWF2_35_9]|nr:MAG: flagellar protein export ATPase FliI [Candidatus Margulisbacteria bacterium GWF2_35_9]